MTVAQVRAGFFALIRDVQAGEEIDITRNGRIVARLTPARGPHGQG
jgi:prevent-host-death family protein